MVSRQISLGDTEESDQSCAERSIGRKPGIRIPKQVYRMAEWEGRGGEKEKREVRKEEEVEAASHVTCSFLFLLFSLFSSLLLLSYVYIILLHTHLTKNNSQVRPNETNSALYTMFSSKERSPSRVHPNKTSAHEPLIPRVRILARIKIIHGMWCLLQEWSLVRGSWPAVPVPGCPVEPAVDISAVQTCLPG